jgi:hypothetical protein
MKSSAVFSSSTTFITLNENCPAPAAASNSML